MVRNEIPQAPSGERGNHQRVRDPFLESVRWHGLLNQGASILEHLCQSGMETLFLQDSSASVRGQFKHLDSVNKFVNTRSIFSNGMIYAGTKGKFDCLERRQYDRE
jgi:hypothetical protein